MSAPPPPFGVRPPGMAPSGPGGFPAPPGLRPPGMPGGMPPPPGALGSMPPPPLPGSMPRPAGFGGPGAPGGVIPNGLPHQPGSAGAPRVSGGGQAPGPLSGPPPLPGMSGAAPLVRPPGVQPGMPQPPLPGAAPLPAPGGPPGSSLPQPAGVAMAPAAPTMLRPQGAPGAPLGMPPPPGAAGMGAPAPAAFGMPPPPGPPMLGPRPGMPPPPGMPQPPGMGMVPPPPPGMPGMPPPPPGAAGPPGMVPGPPGFQGMAPPPPMGGMGMAGDPYGAQRGMQQMMEQFESLTIGGAAPGQESVNINELPRPVGDFQERAVSAPPPYDMFNCSPDNMRLTVNAFPNSTALRARWPLPIGAVVHPMADEAHGRQVPVVGLGPAGIVRCRRCRTYMNPFMTWVDGGRRFKCNVCAMLNEVPLEYFCNVDHEGRRRDFEERPELCTGTVEYIAPQEYMVRPPMPPVYFFVLDVSYSAVSTGMLACACAAIKSCLGQLPGEGRTLVGFLTFDSTLHFYNLKAGLTNPQMMVVAELEEPFLPLPDDLLVNANESRSVIEALLDSLPNTFSGSSGIESATGPALQAAFQAVQHIGGKMLLFQAAIPSLGVGKLRNRENHNAYGTDREPAMRQPDDPFYKRFAADCSRCQITLDIFAFGHTNMDLASLAAIPRFTCGDLYHYPNFTLQRDGDKLRAEVARNLLRPTAWEAVMRVRCSKGLRISSFHGHFFNRSTDLLALPTCDPDKAFAVQIAHEENMVQSSIAYVQCALLYTSSDGERRIRVHTMCVPITTELSDMYRAADAGATAAMLAKLSVEKSLQSRLDETRLQVQTKVVAALKEFRLLNANIIRGPTNRLIFPDTLRYLPLFALGIIKTAALRGGAKEANPDERIVVGHDLMAAPVDMTLRAAYPDLYPLHETGGDWGVEGPDGSVLLPQTIPLSGAYLEERGAYLLDNGRLLVLWLGRLLDKQWGQEVFGMDLDRVGPDASQLQPEPERPGSALSRRVNNLLNALRSGRPLHQQVFVVRQGSPLEMHVAPYFVEDRGPGQPSYADWVLSLYKGVMAK